VSEGVSGEEEWEEKEDGKWEGEGHEGVRVSE
jgi:hypothetical protein